MRTSVFVALMVPATVVVFVVASAIWISGWQGSSAGKPNPLEATAVFVATCVTAWALSGGSNAV